MPTVEKVGRYEIVGELGRGAMGLVYRAVDPNIGRTVALKTMRLDVHGMDHDELLRRFRYEAKAAGAMNHPNIVTVYDADEVDGLFYIAMEYLEGQTLQSIMLEKQVIPGDQIVDIAKQVAAGLDYANEMKVIHRDIKPANIMITRQNVAKIMDFGISKAAGSMTHSGQVLGTPNYMSPEQVKGRELDGRADLFSFGVVLYEMATGERPFTGQNVTTIIYKIIHENPIPASELEVSVHPGLSTIIGKCLSKNPAERYQTGAELARDMENYRSIGSEGETTSVLSNEVRAAATQPVGSSSGGWVNGAAHASGSHAAAAVQEARIASSSGPVPQLAQQPSRLAPSTTTTQTSATQLWGERAKTVSLAIVVISALAAGATLFSTRYWKNSEQSSTPQEQVQRPTSALAQQNSQPQAENKAVSATHPSLAPIHASGKAVPVSDRIEMRFTSTPEGAAVQIDGLTSAAWTTPFSASDLKLGAHTVVFTKPGYTEETRKLELNRSSSLYHINLSPVITSISVTSEPPGADIEIDGTPTGKVTPARVPVAEGQHRVVVHLDGYRNAQVTATVNKAQIFRFSPVLNPTDAREAGNSNAVTARFKKLFGGGIPAGKGMIDFVTTPPGAKIVVNGKSVAIATPAHAPFPPGNYRIELRQSGYKPVQQTVHVEVGKISKVEAKLDPQ